MSRARDFADLAGSADAGGLTGRNLIINGAMQVAQRGTSSTTSGIRTVDRTSNTFGTVAVTQTQDTTVPSGEGFSNSFKNECTTASSDAGAFFGIEQKVEAQDIRNSGWDYTSASSYITLSFWARSSVAGTYMCGLRTNDGTQYNISSQYTLVADTWKKVEVSFPGNSNLTINNDNGIGLNVFPVLELGSNYTSGSSFDTWTAHSASTQSPDANILFHDTANATFFVTGVQIEVGEQATPFEHRSYGEELALCQRYFAKIECHRRYLTLARESDSLRRGSIFYPTPARTTSPTITITDSTGDGVTIAMTRIDGNSCTAYANGGASSTPFVDEITMDAEL
jgi:hypothetical protein